MSFDQKPFSDVVTSEPSQSIEEIVVPDSKVKRAKTPLSVSVKKPSWLKTQIPTGSTFFNIKKDLRSKNLHTVCEEAKCPNIGACWATNTATFMILGDTCTRACRFCNVKTGNPGGWLDPKEPERVAESVSVMNLQYAVITMVDRDDLEDGGSAHSAAVFRAVKTQSPQTKLEFLGGDFNRRTESLQNLLSEDLEVFAHNLETVERLTPRVRDARAGYRKSLEVLRKVKALSKGQLLTKSALMLGLGETIEEVINTLKDLRDHEVDIVTIGQYMRPSKRHLSIKEFVPPEEFDRLKEIAMELGFLSVASGPLVRSSFKASVYYDEAIKLKSSLGEG